MYFFFVDANHNIVGNPNLRAETAHNLQAGLTLSQKKSEWRINTFFNALENEIRLLAVSDPSEGDPRGLFRNENIDRSQTIGVNANYRFQSQKLQIDAGVAFTGIKNNLAFNAPQTERFWWMSQFRLNCSFSLPWWNTKLNLFSNYTAPRKDLVIVDDQIEASKFEGFALVDLSVQRDFWDKRLHLNLGVKNLLNVSSVQAGASAGGVHSGGNQMLIGYGRTFFLRGQINLGK
jgi:outer membrane receptor for ferrienterochelin and colicins